MFHSIYDILLAYSQRRNMDESAMLRLLRREGFDSKKIAILKNSLLACLDATDKEKIRELFGITEIELKLLMGFIPPEYQKSYFDNVSQIASMLSEEQLSKPEKKDIQPYYSTNYGSLFNSDCMEILPQIPDESVDLIFADPPFNLGKDYENGQNDSLSTSQYLEWSKQWLDECVRVLKYGAAIYIYNMPKWCIHYSHYLDSLISFQNWIAIDMKNGLPIKGKYTPSHYGLLYFIKGDKAKTFNRQRVPIQTCRHCGGELKDYGGYKKKMNVLGVNVSDVWYDIYPVRKDKNRPYNELDIKLLERIISCSTNEGDLVLDPFGGSGSTYAVAELLKRRWIGIELGNCDYIQKRLEAPDGDMRKLRKIEKNSLFTEKAKRLRRKNHYWLPGEL